jgi:hypothetical protein
LFSVYGQAQASQRIIAAQLNQHNLRTVLLQAKQPRRETPPEACIPTDAGIDQID